MLQSRLSASLLLILLLSACGPLKRSSNGESGEGSQARALWLEGVRARFSRDLSTAATRFERLARRHANTPEGREAALRAALFLLDPTTPIFAPARAASLLSSYLSQQDAPKKAEVERLQVLVDELVAARSRTDALERDVVQLREITNSLLEERNQLLRETARQDSIFLQRQDSVLPRPATEPTRPDTATAPSR